MTIEKFKLLIQNLPVRSQCFTTKRENLRWMNDESVFNWYEPFKDLHFKNNGTLTISRQDIFDINYSYRELIIKTIYWGYPRGMRGNHFMGILENIGKLEIALANLKNLSSPDQYDYLDIADISRTIPGLALSTLSKLLYFLDVTFKNNPALILDQRLIDVFSGNVFVEYKSLGRINYDNAYGYYLEYLALTDQLASKMGTKAENIEQFLFIFGKNIKHVN